MRYEAMREGASGIYASVGGAMGYRVCMLNKTQMNGKYQIVDLPDPHPGPGQVRIKVRAAGISASDAKIRRGELSFGATLPQTTGADVAGVVDEIGAGVTDVTVGDRVFGISDDQAAGARAARPIV